MRPAERIAAWTIRAYARAVVRREVELRVEGLEHLPGNGPVVIAARHVHHLLDAAILLAVIPRPVHFLVALDWVDGPWGRRVMEAACRMARWPAVLRPDAPKLGCGAPDAAYRPDEAFALARRAFRDVSRLMHEGRVLVAFPEGYPNVDPEGSRKADLGEMLPFRPGFARLAARAARELRAPIPIVPAGFGYRRADSERRWRVVLRFGGPTWLGPGADVAALVDRMEQEVRALSAATVLASE